MPLLFIVGALAGASLLVFMLVRRHERALAERLTAISAETLRHVSEHLQHFSRGILDSRDVVLYLTWVGVTLFLSIRAMSTGKSK